MTVVPLKRIEEKKVTSARKKKDGEHEGAGTPKYIAKGFKSDLRLIPCHKIIEKGIKILPSYLKFASNAI